MVDLLTTLLTTTALLLAAGSTTTSQAANIGDDDLKTFKFEMESMAYGDAYLNSESEDEFRFGGSRANVDLIKRTLEELRASRSDVLNLAVYYESLCPDSRRFIIGGLQAAYMYLKDITNVILIPYGKANVSSDQMSLSIDRSLDDIGSKSSSLGSRRTTLGTFSANTVRTNVLATSFM